MATIAIGDVHGNIAAFDDLLRQLESELTSDDVVVFLGDYIDRGDSTKECVDRILALQDDRPDRVVCLCGNHEDWLLRSLHDYRQHTWLLATDALTTIRSYSVDAADVLSEACSRLGSAVYGDNCPLPYEVFFECLPLRHIQFFETLRTFYEGPDCLCTHGGLNPKVSSVREQTRHSLIWGASGFPEKYNGPQLVVYGHWNNAILNADGWPLPVTVGRTIGIDTISHGVLTAVRLPDLALFQSGRYETPDCDD